MFVPRVLGEVVAPSSLPAEAFALVLDAARCPLVLAPCSERGWFGGAAVVAWDPVAVEAGVPLEVAAAALEAAYDSRDPELACVLAEYERACAVARYAGALVRTESGWRTWGAVPADAVAVCEAAERAAGGGDAAVFGALLADATWDMSGRAYRAGVEKTRERIAAGDVYVLNLTARLSGTLRADPARGFAELVSRAPADFAAFVRWPGGKWIASVSPERFVRISRGEDDARLAEVCPIKGTRPRGADAVDDERLAEALAADEKERAEHVMVVDLERNDLGVSCVPGTIHLDPLYEIVTTPYCHQLVSSVRGTLRSDAPFAEALTALFPCGSVTGAPKVAAMRIARELEATVRGAYCGALLVAVPGAVDSSVVIRTLEGDASEIARWGSGCGITYDSDLVSEHLELLLKVSPLLGDAPPAVALRETMRVAFGRAPLLERHLARLAQGGAGPSTLSRVRARVAAVLAGVDATLDFARLGVTVTPDGEVAVGVTQQRSSLEVEGGPRLAVVQVAELPALPPAAAKPASRRYWDRAHNAAQMQGADQAILVDGDGRIIDGSTANVWLVREGELLTPPAPPAVAGVAREAVFDIAARLGIVALERVLDIADFETADEVWLSNGVGGFVSVRDRRGPLGTRIAEEFERPFRAR